MGVVLHSTDSISMAYWEYAALTKNDKDAKDKCGFIDYSKITRMELRETLPSGEVLVVAKNYANEAIKKEGVEEYKAHRTNIDQWDRFKVAMKKKARNGDLKDLLRLEMEGFTHATSEIPTELRRSNKQ